jgi:hypothetical protein
MGRKRLRLIDDPDRYMIALIDALIAQGRGSEYACAMSIATLLIGIEGEAPKLSTDGRHIVTTWGRYQTKAEPGTAMTLGGRVSTFRAKRRRYRSAADLRWRTTMGAAFQAVFTLTDRPQAKRVALAAAKIVGETEFAYRVLWPMIDGEA